MAPRQPGLGADVSGAGRGGRDRGFVSPETLVGLLLALGAMLMALTLARGCLVLAESVAGDATDAGGALWALDRIAAEVGRAGLGVPPAGAAGSPDEGVELLEAGAVGVRGDLDGDDRALAHDPEDQLAGVFPIVTTGNDEVVVFYRRAGSRGGSERAVFEADLDSSDRIELADGSLLARRDGLVESIDAGPFARVEDERAGTLYRVSFVHDARRAGSGRFRVTQPLLDRVRSFRVRAYDDSGAEVAPCGGGDGPSVRACRASVRRFVLELVMADSGETFEREISPRGLQ